MQKVIPKFLVSILISFAFSSNIFANNVENELVKADSLYSIKLYTQSIKIYESILEEEKATPAMLLKMARIEEGLNNYGCTIYYLEKYFELTEDKRVLEHIQQIAKKEKLSGYSYDFPFYAGYYYDKYQPLILLLLSIALISLLALMFKHKASRQKKQYFPYIVIVIIIAGIANNLSAPDYAVITDSPVYLLEGPSAASNAIERVEGSHRIKVKGDVDVWTETEWNENKAYIKTDRLKKL